MELQTQQAPESFTDTEQLAVVDMRDVVGMLVSQIHQMQSIIGTLYGEVNQLKAQVGAAPRNTTDDSETGQYL